MTEREEPINPEIIRGREFRMPAIVGLGTGSDYKLEGLHLPIGWKKSISDLTGVSQDGMQRFFELDCKDAHLSPGELKFDNNTNILTEIIIPTTDLKRPARLYLETRYPRNEEGIYTSENVDNLRAAIILQSMACRFLSFVDPESSYAYVERSGNGYHSVDLKIPEKILKVKEPITNEFTQRRFEIKASNIAGRFGLDPMLLKFDEKGLFTNASLGEGGARYYQFDPSFNNYFPHNVDSSCQAAALHGVCAAFINSQLQQRSKEGWY
jgi:hypothetical protein